MSEYSVYLASYATERFRNVRGELNDSANKYGIVSVFSYDESDLHTSEYYTRNKSILDEICGAGYWAWKPYFIIKALDSIDDGDVLFYCDAGSTFIDSPTPLIKLAKESPNGIILFDKRPLTNRQFTKRDCFVRLGCDEAKYWNANGVIATILVIRKCEMALVFLKEWLHYCQDRAAITDDDNTCGMPDLPEFLQHRWDQAILSVLAAKHEIETFRNPSMWGNFLKLPEFRIPGEVVVSPYNLIPEINTYATHPQINSPYGTIFLFNRQPNMIGKKPLPSINKAGQPTLPVSPKWSVITEVARKIRQKLNRALRLHKSS